MGRHSICVSTLGLVALDPNSDRGALEAGQGDLEAVLAHEERRLFGIAFSILRDCAEAQDVVQETAAAAWRGWARRTDPAKTRAWLTTICLRGARRRRRHGLRRVLVGDLRRAELERCARHLAGPGGRDLDLHRAHAALSTRQRAVISLHYWHGYSVAECAELLECRPGTVAQHLSRGLARLRKELGDG